MIKIKRFFEVIADSTTKAGKDGKKIGKSKKG